MYVPNSFAERDLPTLFAFMKAHPFATLVTHSPADGMLATHLPLLLDPAAGPFGTVAGHIARANGHARLARDRPTEALVIFTGPDAYITPSWYSTKQETGRVVPTWNYVAVHGYGALTLRDDPDFMRAHLETLTRRHEQDRGSSWQVGDAPAEYLARQLQAIAGVEIRLERLEGKWKMNQNRPVADIDGVVQGLGQSPLPADQAVAAIMQARRPRAE